MTPGSEFPVASEEAVSFVVESKSLVTLSVLDGGSHGVVSREREGEIPVSPSVGAGSAGNSVLEA